MGVKVPKNGKYGRQNRPENTEYCRAEACDVSGWHPHQCSRKRGHGPNGEFCKQHAKMADENGITDW